MEDLIDALTRGNPTEVNSPLWRSRWRCTKREERLEERRELREERLEQR